MLMMAFRPHDAALLRVVGLALKILPAKRSEHRDRSRPGGPHFPCGGAAFPWYTPAMADHGFGSNQDGSRGAERDSARTPVPDTADPEVALAGALETAARDRSIRTPRSTSATNPLPRYLVSMTRHPCQGTTHPCARVLPKGARRPWRRPSSTSTSAGPAPSAVATSAPRSTPGTRTRPTRRRARSSPRFHWGENHLLKPLFKPASTTRWFDGRLTLDHSYAPRLSRRIMARHERRKPRSLVLVNPILDDPARSNPGTSSTSSSTRGSTRSSGPRFRNGRLETHPPGVPSPRTRASGSAPRARDYELWITGPGIRSAATSPSGPPASPSPVGDGAADGPNRERRSDRAGRSSGAGRNVISSRARSPSQDDGDEERLARSVGRG